MLIDNATLDRIVTPAVPDADGGTTPGAATDLAIRCTLDAPQRRHQFDVGALVKDVTAVVYVMASDLAARPAEGARLLVTPDDLPQQALAAIAIIDRVHGDQSHFEILCKGGASS